MAKDQFLVKIHGLRGLSILLVLLFHFYESIFRGGYLGVDIFFVISGYIVSKSTLKYWPQNKKDIFGFLKIFYINRIARLLPVGIVVSTISFILGLYFTSVGETKLLVNFYRSSVLGFANILLFINQRNYFSLSQEFNYFTQTWSLGVEEQFYVVYSFLICFFPFFNKRIIQLFFGITIISILINVGFLGIGTHEGHFYLLPFRLWEMSLGVFLFLKQDQAKKILERFKPFFEIYTPLALVAAFFIKYSPNSFPFPILPIIYPAACYIIVFSDEYKGSFLDKALSLKFLSFFGTISYSLYLVHWPVLVFTKYTFGKGYLAMTVGMIVSVALSYVVTHYLEKPINLQIRKNNRYMAVLLSLTCILLASATYFTANNKFYIAYPLDTDQMQWKQDFKGCIETSEDINARVKNCFSPKRKNSENVIFVAGDSHAGQIGVMLNSFAKKNGYETVLLHSGDKANSIHQFEAKDWKSNPAIFEELQKNAKPNDIAVFTFASYQLNKSNSSHLKKATELWKKYLNQLISNHIKVILIVDSPYYPITPIESCVFDSKFKSQSRCEMTRDEYLKQRTKQETFFRNLQKEIPAILVWDMINEFCNEKCSLIENGRVNYFDYNHISKERALELEPAFTKFFNTHNGLSN